MNDLFEELANVFPRVDSDVSIGELVVAMKDLRQRGSRIFFIGNGGSAAIASHMAADYLCNGRFAAMSFNEAEQITCIANDVNYQSVFSLPLQRHASSYDWLFAISSSGESKNILWAVEQAKSLGLYIVTLSGFRPNNSLRYKGNANFYVPSARYGVVEIVHLAICHSILDQCCAEALIDLEEILKS